MSHIRSRAIHAAVTMVLAGAALRALPLDALEQCAKPRLVAHTVEVRILVDPAPAQHAPNNPQAV